MIQTKSWLPLAFLMPLLLHLVMATVPQNYSEHVLRFAKAAHMRAYMQDDVNPCEDFYQFACGTWPKLQPATTGEKTSSLQELQDLYVRKSAQMLEVSRRVDSTVERKLKNFYASCRNASDNELKQGLEAIIGQVKLHGGWPHITDMTWYEDTYDWLQLIAELRRKLGVNILIGLEVIPDLEDINTHRIRVGAPTLPLLTKEIYLQEQHASTRTQYMQSIVGKLRRYFREMSDNWATEVAQQVLQMEQALAHGLPDNAQALTLQQKSRLRAPAELRDAYGNYVDLSRYLYLIFNETIYVQVYEAPLDYMSNLVEVVRNTPKLTIANYTMWRVLDAFSDALNSERTAQWCVQQVRQYFALPLERMFQRQQHHNMQLINELQSVWADLKKVFRERWQTSEQLNWVTRETRQKALLKLDAMTLEFSTHDDIELAAQLQSLRIEKQPQQYFYNLLQVLQWQTRRELAQLLEKPQQTTVKTTDAAPPLPTYMLSKNQVLIPITFLQSRFFWDAAYPHALKYSTLGYLLATQMAHGFDKLGHRYDSHGYHRTWWDITSEYAYSQHVKCFEEYWTSHYGVPEGKYLAEMQRSIADIVGLSLSYEAYQQWWQNIADTKAALAATENLPQLNYTQHQLFFLGYAQLWCADYQQSAVEQEIPERMRVISALANSANFAKQFQCDVGLHMNPAEKCKIY